jgi:hypothetical protein
MRAAPNVWKYTGKEKIWQFRVYAFLQARDETKEIA